MASTPRAPGASPNVLPEADVVIVGMGWAGSILAAELTKAGMRVVGLERGPDRHPADEEHARAHDELRFRVRGDLVQNTALETWTLRHDLREEALPLRTSGAFRPGEGVGGSGVAWGAGVARLTPHDFRSRSATVGRYGEVAIPEGSTIQDWGIAYQDLEPYYDRFERTLGVSGIAGNIRGERRDGGDPFEGPRGSDFPLPPLVEARTATTFKLAARELGLRPFPQPNANLSRPYTDPDGISRPACTYCGFCVFHPCRIGAKADPLVTVLPVARRTGRFELRTGCRVFEVVHDGWRARGVRYYDQRGEVREQRAAVVVLAAYTLGNVRLLLLSKLGTPYDPRTGAGQVGRNYAYQSLTTATAFFRERSFQRYMGAFGSSWAVEEWNGDNFDHTGLGFIGGGLITCGVRGTPIGALQVPPGTPPWGAEWKDALRTWYDRSVTLAAVGEVLAYRDAMLDLDPRYRDAWGLPLLRITFDWHENERRIVGFLGAKMREIVAAMRPDAQAVRAELPPHFDVATYQSTHNTGGAIMGADPSSSVVNRYLQMWSAHNVFVVGASAFPQNGAHGPTATVGALAYLAAEAIGRYRARPGTLV